MRGDDRRVSYILIRSVNSLEYKISSVIIYYNNIIIYIILICRSVNNILL